MEILATDNVDEINRIAKSIVYSDGFVPVLGGEKDAKWQVNLHGFDDLEKDSSFTENVCRIIERTYAKADNEVVINQFLAETNQIKIGDTVSFILGNENVSAKVIGFYFDSHNKYFCGRNAFMYVDEK